MKCYVVKTMRDGKLDEIRTRVYQVSPDTTADLCPRCRLVSLPSPCAKSHLSHSEYLNLVGSHDDE